MDCSSTSKICKLKNSESKEGPWSDLVVDVLHSIACRLTLRDRIRMAAACRRWRSIRCRTFRPLEPPWLMAFQQRDNRGLVESIDSSSNKAYSLLLREVSYTWVLSASNGWLLLCREDLIVFFLNPITRQSKFLPPLDLPGRSKPSCFKAAFSSPPTSPDCTVVVISIDYNQFQTWQPGSEHWTPPCRSDDILLPTSALQPFFCRGILWCMYYKGTNVCAFVIDPAEKKWMVHDIPIRGIKDWGQLYMTGFEGELFLISVSIRRNPRVFKLSQSLEDVKEIKSLGNCTVYLGYKMVLMAISRVRGMKNKIYFPKTWRNERCLRYYCMKTRKFNGKLGFCMADEIKLLRSDHNAYTEQIWVEPNDSLA